MEPLDAKVHLKRLSTHMSSSGEMKISDKEMICSRSEHHLRARDRMTYIFVSEMLQKLQLSIGSFTQHGCGEGFHDFLDGDGCCRELVLCGTVEWLFK